MSEEHSRAHDEQSARSAHSNSGHQNAYDHSVPRGSSPGMPEIAAAPSLLANHALKERGNGPVRIALMRQMQSTYGNRATRQLVQRLIGTRSDGTATVPGNNLGANISISPAPMVSIVIQRMKPNEVHIGKTYEFKQHKTDESRIGKLISASGGWYRFENEGLAQGAKNVIRLVEATTSASSVIGEVAEEDEQEQIEEDEKGKEKEERPRRKQPAEQDDRNKRERKKPRETPSVAKIILDVAHKAGIRDDILLSMLIDLAQEGFRRENKELIQYYLDDPKGWQGFSACHDTAAKLFNRFKQGEINLEQTATRGDGQSIQNTASALYESISDRADAEVGAIYHITYGIHGFVILAREGRAELLQSFAGDSGEHLTESLRAGKAFTPDKISKLLTNMTSNKKGQRKAAQTTLFDGFIEDDDNTWPDVEFKWKMASVQTGENIEQLVKDLLESRLRLLRNLKVDLGEKAKGK